MEPAFEFEEFEFVAEIDNCIAEMSYEQFLDYIELPENMYQRFELAEGRVVAMSSPTSKHQFISGEIARKTGNYLEGKQCRVFQDLNVHLYKEGIGKETSVFRPDVLVGCDREKITDRGYEGTPEWIVEVISKSNPQHDYLYKLAYYMRYGVKEYWIVDHFANLVTIYKNSNEEKYTVKQYTFSDRIQVGIFSDLHIDFSEVLALISDM